MGQYLAERSKHARNADQGVCLWCSHIQTQRRAHHGGNAPKSRAQRSTCTRSLSVSKFTIAQGPDKLSTLQEASLCNSEAYLDDTMCMCMCS